MKAKINILKCDVAWSVFINGCKTWTINETRENKD